MFKKLLSVAAAAVIGMSFAQAETVDCYYHDWSTETSWNKYVMGYIPQVIDGELVCQAPMVEYIEINDENAEKYADEGWDSWDVIAINSKEPNSKIRPLESPPSWYRCFIEYVNGKKQMTHFLTIECYAPELEEDETAEFTLQCRWAWNNESFINCPVTIDSKEAKKYTVVCEAPAADGWDVIFLTSYQGPIHIKTFAVSYENIEIVQEFENIVTNGDASEDWDNPNLGHKEDGWLNVVAWGKEDKGDPHPATIETEDGDRRFVVHATAMTENPWDNQFWICLGRSFETGDEFRLSFKMKATAAAAPQTQSHHEPSEYFHNVAIGNPQFTTDWTEFVKDVSVDGSMGGIQSIAFNLNDYNAANDYWVDDIKVEVAKVQEGWFIASDDNAKGLLGAAKEMTVGYNEQADAEGPWAIIGAEGNYASWFKISTQKGADSAFNAGGIYTADELVDDDWFDYTEGAAKKMDLPEEGIWLVFLDTDNAQIYVLNVTDGISFVNADNAPAVYYNLQGVQVENPNNGVFIVKKGNRVYKQVIR